MKGWTGQPHPVLLSVLAGLIGWLLPAFMDAWANGSPGKRLLKLRVVNRKAQAPGLLRSIWRHTLKYTLNLALPGLFHHIQQAIFGERSMHNALAGTHVVASRRIRARFSRRSPRRPRSPAQENSCSSCSACWRWCWVAW